jgi:zinc protease
MSAWLRSGGALVIAAVAVATFVTAPAATAAEPAARGVKLPAFERLTLANGTQVALLERHDTPLVSITAVIRGGAVGDAPGKEGTASLLADLLQKGAGERDAAQFAEAVESVGAQLTAATGRENIVAGGSFLSKDSALVLGLFADMLMRPRLDPAEFEKARELTIQGIAAAKDGDPSGLLADYGNAWLLGSHAYARPADGDSKSLVSIGLDDIKRYYAEQVGGDRLILAVVGDFNGTDMHQRLEAAFGGWRKAGAAAPAIDAPVRQQGRRVLLVDKPGATQTYFWLANVGASRTDAARTAQSVVNTLFGGRFTSMLNTELRVKSGLTYGASSSFTRLRQPGAFAISSYTETDKTAAALDLAFATLDRLHKDGLDATSLDSAKSYILGQFPTALETNGQLAGKLADLMLYDLGPDDVDGFASRVAAVDATVARATIDRSFPKSTDLAIVLIGDAAKIRDVARHYGPLTEMKLSDPTFSPVAAP